MKVERLTESKEFVLKQHLTEDVDQVRARVREFLEERLNATTDNIAIKLASEVEGYDPHWCYTKFYGNFVDQLIKARLTFLNKLESFLFAEAPTNEALKEAVDMSAMKYAVIKPNGEYAGVPCESVDEARELAAQEEGRVVFKLSKVLFGESYDKDGNHEKCDKCGTLLNDAGTCTCPKCDDGEDYGDEPCKKDLDELRNETDDDYDADEDDEIEESLVMESATNYDFRRGDEVIEGMNGNLDDKELDKQIRYLTRVAKRLGLKRVNDLVMYVDDEWVYDPTMFDSRFFTLPDTPNEFTVDGITFIAAKEFNQIWLYFRSEEDGTAYLSYCDARA